MLWNVSWNHRGGCFQCRKARSRASGWSVAACLLALLTGCSPDPVRVYKAPKEVSSNLAWELPAGWKEQPGGEMRVASFAISGEGDKKAEVAIIPLPLIEGRATEFVNLWCEQLKIKALSAEEAAKLQQPVAIGSESGQMFDLAGTEKVIEDKFAMRIVAATLNRSSSTWFIKMSGEAGLVGDNKAAFVQFLKSLNLPATPPQRNMAHGGAGGDPHGGMAPQGGAAPQGAAPAAEGESEAPPQWTVPPQWKTKPAGQMLLATFTVGADSTPGTVTVSAFPGSVGGPLANVNRWRNQIGLTPATEAELPKLLTPLQLESGEASLVDFSNGPNRLIAVMQPHGGKTWFYKLLGPETVVGTEKEAFINFVKSVRYAGP